MKKSRYFAELSHTYSSEIDDLLSDSEGKTVLDRRLKEKRSVFAQLLPMIEYSPEMVAVVFFDAFTFTDTALLAQAVTSEPGRPAFPSWSTLAKTLKIAPWAVPLIEATRREPIGDDFLVTTVGLEFLRQRDSADASAESVSDEEKFGAADEDGDDEALDLSEAGNDWMAGQGFDSLDH